MKEHVTRCKVAAHCYVFKTTMMHRGISHRLYMNALLYNCGAMRQRVNLSYSIILEITLYSNFSPDRSLTDLPAAALDPQPVSAAAAGREKENDIVCPKNRLTVHPNTFLL